MADHKEKNQERDAEVFDLLKKADEQYWKYVKLAKLTEFPDFIEDDMEEDEAEYSWKAPKGLVITKRSPIGLVITKSRKNRLTVGSVTDLYA